MLQARDGFVINGAERIPFGALAEAAAGFDPPSEIPPRDAAAPRLVGRSLPRLDAPPKLDGAARFGADVRLPNMVYASRSEEHTSELQSLMRISYAVFCLKKKKKAIRQ